MKKVYYIGWYISDEDKAKYSGNVPGNLKMHYVARKIQEAGFSLHILSLANRSHNGLYFNKNKAISSSLTVTYFGGYSGISKWAIYLNYLLKQILLAYYLVVKTTKADTIIVYHSVAITSLVASLNYLLKRHIICEVEEIYGYSASHDDLQSVKKEYSSILKYNSFILINDYIQEELNIANDDFCPCYGVVDISKRKKERLNDGYIHVVYAGTIEGRKQGAYQAVEAAEFLPTNYKMHILGFGKDEHVNQLKEKIQEVNDKHGYEMVIYDGFKSGDDLDQYLYSCHIGISTYVMRDTFANHSLPSKIFTYMCHDLAVVRGYASAYEEREISRNWTFYKEDTPQAIACAIQAVKIPQLGYNISFLQKCDNRLIEFLRKKCY